MTNRRTPAKRHQSSTWKPTRARSELLKAIGGAAAVVAVTVLLIFVMKPGDSNSTPAPCRSRRPNGPDPVDRTTRPADGPRPSAATSTHHAAMTAASPRPAFEAGLGFALDPFQRRALDALDAGQSVLSWPRPPGRARRSSRSTRSGSRSPAGRRRSTRRRSRRSRTRSTRTSCGSTGPENVGLLTGDNAVNGNAPIVVMTTEVLRNMIYAGPTRSTGSATSSSTRSTTSRTATAARSGRR